MGTNKWLWFVPVNMHLKDGDGLAFQRVVRQSTLVAEDESAAARADEVEIELGILNSEQVNVL